MRRDTTKKPRKGTASSIVQIIHTFLVVFPGQQNRPAQVSVENTYSINIEHFILMHGAFCKVPSKKNATSKRQNPPQHKQFYSRIKIALEKSPSRKTDSGELPSVGFVFQNTRWWCKHTHRIRVQRPILLKNFIAVEYRSEKKTLTLAGLYNDSIIYLSSVA